MADRILTSSQLKDKLDSVRSSIQAVSNTDEFGVSSTVQTEDPTMKDNYKSGHKSSVRCTVFFGPIWIAEIVGVEHREENSKTPVYHYASEYFSDVLEGKYIVRGNLYMYETKTNELQATIAKYKELLRKENYSRQLIKDIVSQRNNLFQADLTTRLLTKYGPEEAARITTDALKKINSELITGRDWDVPKLIIVSGDISDPNPAIDVFDDITFDTSSKAILADGTTQIKVISWFGKRRPIRDTPLRSTLQSKTRIDLDATVRSYVDNFFKSVQKYFKVTIKEFSFPVSISPNNLGYIGNLPEAISGWGPELCMTPIKVEQFGLPDDLAFNFDIVTYRESDGPEAAQEIIKNNTPFQYRSYIVNNNQRESRMKRPWRYFFPDPDYLLQSTHFISRALPTHRALSYSWITPPPAIPGAIKDGNASPVVTDLLGNILLADSDYTYREEDAHAVTGSTLTSAFCFVSMYSSFDEKGTTFVRAPVRGFTYFPPVSVSEEPGGDKNSRKVTIRDFAPIVGTDLFAVMNSNSIPADLTPENSVYLKSKKDTVDATLNDKYEVLNSNNEPRINPNDFNQIIKPPDGIIGDEWFIMAPTIGIGGAIGTLLDLALPDSVTSEDLTLGIIGNTDKVNFYDVDLQDGFRNYPFGVGVDNISVQVFPLATPKSLVRGNTWLGSLSLQFGSHARINRALACAYFLGSDCLKPDSINYIYNLSGFNKVGPDKRLAFSCTWNKKTVSKTLLSEKIPLMLVRVLSAQPKMPLTSGAAAKNIVQPTYVSAATTMPSSKVAYTALVRCDRSYVAFDQRWPADIFNSMARISTEAGMDTFKPAMARCIQLFSGTMRVMKHHSSFTALTQNAPVGIIGVPMTLAAGIAISTVAVSVKTIGLLGSGILDSAEGIWNVAINLPIINFAVETLDALGIDLAGIFQDTTIVRGDNPPIMNLLRTSVYSEGERYVLIKDKLTQVMVEDLYLKISQLISSDIDKFDGDEILRDSSVSSSSGILYSKIDSQLVGGLNRYFSGGEWSNTRLYGENLDRLMGSIESPKDNGPFNIGAKSTDVYILTRKGTKPSAFVLDEAVKDPNSYKAPDPDPKGIPL